MTSRKGPKSPNTRDVIYERDNVDESKVAVEVEL